jgi:hypothetical protein
MNKQPNAAARSAILSGPAAEGLAAAERVLRQEAQALTQLADGLDGELAKALDILARVTGRVRSYRP